LADFITTIVGFEVFGTHSHLLVDTLGLLLLAVVHSADIQDRDGGILLLATMKGLFPFLEKLFADSAYQGHYLPTGLPKSYPVSKPRSSNDQVKPKGSILYPSVGSSSEPSHGSIVVAVSPRIGKISTATLSRS
jgi:hypothetical protein